jgi:O-antigen ligase
MGALAQRLPAVLQDRETSILAAGLLSASLVGVALAVQVPIGLALVLGPIYAAIVFTNLQLGLALWVPLAFLEGLPVLNTAGKAAGLLVAVAWVGSFRSVRETAVVTLHRHRSLLAVLVGLLAWLSLSIVWAGDSGLAFEEIWRWYVLAFVFLVVVTTVTTPDILRLVLIGFVVGAVISVGIGFADGSLTNPEYSNVTSSVDAKERFSGAAGDPNFLAASMVAATVLLAALFSETRSPLLRGLAAVAAAMMITGFVASGSRGGSLAAGVTVIAALVVFRQQRAQVVAAIAVLLGIAALAFVNVPGAWERVTSFGDDNGRSDLWTVAWRMGEDQPVGGVGLNNYFERSGDYVREPGALENVNVIVDDPHLAHNTYLELFATTGVIGLALFVAVALACLRATKMAADRFEAQGERGLGTLARAVLVATIGMLGAAVFLSAATDKRLWLLLALGPALLATASRRNGRERPRSEPLRPVPATAHPPV